MGYIPTFSLISPGDLDFIHDSSFAQMQVEALNLVGLPYEIKGVPTFRMQYNPRVLEDSASSANYVEHRGLGSQIPTYHYTYTETGPITIPVVITDSYDGPPHATKSNSGGIIGGVLGNATGGIIGGSSSEIVYNDFENLLDVVNWFKNLTHKVEAWGTPPFTRISLGKWNKFGVVTEITKPRIVSMYKNGDPRIIEFSFTIQSNVMVVTSDQAFFEVD